MKNINGFIDFIVEQDLQDRIMIAKEILRSFKEPYHRDFILEELEYMDEEANAEVVIKATENIYGSVENLEKLVGEKDGR